MSDTNNDVAEPRTRTKAAPKKSRRNYASLFTDLEARVRIARPVLENATEADALQRLKIAMDILYV